MTRVHLLVLIVVAIVLTLFALRLSDTADRPTLPANKIETSPAIQPGVPPSESRPAGSIGREDPGVGTTSLPRGPGSLERP